MVKKISKNVKTVLNVLKDEVRGDVRSALRKITKDYTMTWVDTGLGGKHLFPSSPRKGKTIKQELEGVYPIKGREYDIRNITEGDDLVMVELVESYPDPKTKKAYRTPLVLVLEMEKGKIRTGRHYLDPKLSSKFLSKKQIEKVFKGKKKKKLIIK